ncbi:MAG: hypothetical protein QNK14_09230 [Desulfobacterales bacterium]|nr:hypothetical protein [Desulfobacterales bacterium]
MNVFVRLSIFFTSVSSGYSNEPILSEHIRYGFMGVVVKPYKLGKLSQVILEVLKAC